MAVIACNGFASSTSGADLFVQASYVGTGAVIWVDSVNGNDSNSGSEGQPLASLAQAITNATANNGDLIVVKSGHSEIISSTVTLSKAGVRIFGIGNGTAAPKFTVAGALDGIHITGADVELNNIYFPVGTTAINTSRISCDAARPRIKNCRFNCGVYDSNSIVLTANAIAAIIDSVSMSVTADGPDGGIVVQSASAAGLQILNSAFDGGTANFDDAAIYSNVAHLNYRYESITLTNDASIKHSNAGNKGMIGNLIEGDGSAVQT